MFKLLASMEDIKQTQRLHSATLQTIMRQLKNSDVPSMNELPEAIRFPIETSDEVDDLEKRLQDASTKKTVVSCTC